MPDYNLKSSQIRQWVQSCVAIVPAAGSASRFGRDKLFESLIDQEAVILKTLQSLSAWMPHIICVLRSDQIEPCRQAVLECKALQNHSIEYVEGGKLRSDSVLSGLYRAQKSLHSYQWALVHDGARPCLHASDLQDMLAYMSDHFNHADDAQSDALSEVGSILVEPQRHAMLYRPLVSSSEWRNMPRDQCLNILTPQIFPISLLIRAIQAYPHAYDESQAMMAYTNKNPNLIFSRFFNGKITVSEDIIIAQAILNARKK